MSQRENFYFLMKQISKSSELYYRKPGLYPSITDNIAAMNILIQERHNHSESSIKVKVSRRTQKNEIHHAKEGSVLAFYSMDLGHIFGNDVDNDLGVMLRRKRTDKPEFAYDIVLIHCLMIYTDLIKKISFATRRLPCCIAFFSFPSSKLETI